VNKRICSIGDCNEPHHSRSWCKMHYVRWHRHGDPMAVWVRKPRPIRMCSVEDCDNKHRGRGYCDMHLARVRKHGNPETKLTFTKDDDIGYAAAHLRIRSERGPAREYDCLHCGEPAGEWALNHDAPAARLRSETRRKWEVVFSPNPDDYLPLCPSCHRTYDIQGAADELGHEAVA
jgi:hypothetical protein